MKCFNDSILHAPEPLGPMPPSWDSRANICALFFPICYFPFGSFFLSWSCAFLAWDVRCGWWYVCLSSWKGKWCISCFKCRKVGLLLTLKAPWWAILHFNPRGTLYCLPAVRSLYDLFYPTLKYPRSHLYIRSQWLTLVLIGETISYP